MSNPVLVGSPRKSAAIIPFVNTTLTSGLPTGSIQKSSMIRAPCLGQSAHRGGASRIGRCPAANRTRHRLPRNVENDPTETWAAPDFRSAEELFVPSLRRGIVPLRCMDRPPREGHMAIHIQRREIIVTLGSAVVWPLAASAQQSERMRRI